MGNFDPAKYAPVDQRIAEFYEDFPDGSIRTFIAASDEKSILFEARCFRSLEEARDGIYTSGFAHEIQGAGPVNRTNHVENAETSAIGRALANLGYSGSVDGKRAPRPSREEMQQAAERGRRGSPAPRSRSASDAKPAPLVGLDDEHTAWLETIRRIGAESAEEAVIVIDGHTRNLKMFVRESWAALRVEPGFAKEVAEAMEATP